VADEPEEEQCGEQEAREARHPQRGVVRDAGVHHEGGERLEERELERHLERLAENGELGVEEIDALLVVDARRVGGLRLSERVLLEQRAVERRCDVHDEWARTATTSAASTSPERPVRRDAGVGGAAVATPESVTG
jgi:hypothetical protein